MYLFKVYDNDCVTTININFLSTEGSLCVHLKVTVPCFVRQNSMAIGTKHARDIWQQMKLVLPLYRMKCQLLIML
jgi:hypothetical protein